jgi:hypothetical protein
MFPSSDRTHQTYLTAARPRPASDECDGLADREFWYDFQPDILPCNNRSRHAIGECGIPTPRIGRGGYCRGTQSEPAQPLKTSVHVYPAVYVSSQVTYDPFVIDPHGWLRDMRANPREVIDTTPEAVGDILGGFRMEVEASCAKEAGTRPPRNVTSELYGVWF